MEDSSELMPTANEAGHIVDNDYRIVDCEPMLLSITANNVTFLFADDNRIHDCEPMLMSTLANNAGDLGVGDVKYECEIVHVYETMSQNDIREPMMEEDLVETFVQIMDVVDTSERRNDLVDSSEQITLSNIDDVSMSESRENNDPDYEPVHDDDASSDDTIDYQEMGNEVVENLGDLAIGPVLVELNENTSPKRSRKPSRKEIMWKKRILSAEYNTGKRRERKDVKRSATIQGSCTGCRYTCKNIAIEQQELIFKEYYSFGSAIRRHDFIRRFVDQHTANRTRPKLENRKKAPRMSYTFKLPFNGVNVRVCAKMFTKTLDVSDYFVRDQFHEALVGRSSNDAERKAYFYVRELLV